MALLGHRDEVQSSVETAGQLGQINVKAELITNQVEHLIIVGVLHEIRARPNVSRVLSLCDELEFELIARSRDAVSACTESVLGCNPRL